MKQRFSVMGSHPGDGGVYEAVNSNGALALHVLQDAPELDLADVKRYIAETGPGDYIVRRVPAVAS